MTNHAQVDHIRVCRELWLVHRDSCASCFDTVPPLCEVGQNLWEEYQNSIIANPSCESVEGEPCTNTR